MNIEPDKRFTSAREMRRAIEKIDIKMNWQERATSDGVVWMSQNGTTCYELARITKGDVVEILVRKGKSKSSLMRIKSLCADNLFQAKAKQQSRRLLQDFVLGKIT